jgi:hypothetical protein
MMSSVRAGLSDCVGVFRMLLNERLMMATRLSFAASRCRAQLLRLETSPVAAAAPIRNSLRFMAHSLSMNIVAKLRTALAGPVREQPHRVLASLRARQGAPFAATRERRSWAI